MKTLIVIEKLFELNDFDIKIELNVKDISL